MQAAPNSNLRALIDTTIDDREGISIKEAARIAGMSRSKMYELLRDGTVESRKIGRRRIVSLRSVRGLFR